MGMWCASSNQMVAGFARSERIDDESLNEAIAALRAASSTLIWRRPHQAACRQTGPMTFGGYRMIIALDACFSLRLRREREGIDRRIGGFAPARRADGSTDVGRIDGRSRDRAFRRANRGASRIASSPGALRDAILEGADLRRLDIMARGSLSSTGSMPIGFITENCDEVDRAPVKRSLIDHEDPRSSQTPLVEPRRSANQVENASQERDESGRRSQSQPELISCSPSPVQSTPIAVEPPSFVPRTKTLPLIKPSLPQSPPVHSTSAPSVRRFSTKRGCARLIGVALWITERPSMLAASINRAMATRMI